VQRAGGHICKGVFAFPGGRRFQFTDRMKRRTPPSKPYPPLQTRTGHRRSHRPHVTCAAACLGYLSMCRCLWSHTKSFALFGGTLGENTAWCSCHGSSAQEDGCGLSPAAGPALHVVFCGHRSVFSSPLEANVSPPRIFSTNPPGGPRTLQEEEEDCDHRISTSTVAHLADSFMGLPDAHAIGKSLTPKSKGGGGGA
jgi:hypothetical protein